MFLSACEVAPSVNNLLSSTHEAPHTTTRFLKNIATFTKFQCIRFYAISVSESSFDFYLFLVVMVLVFYKIIIIAFFKNFISVLIL